ncbi:hypothetical protein Tco_0831686 [Tanacetum coccineum]
MDDTQLIEEDLVVDDENLLIETEIQDVDDIDVDKDAEENFIATRGVVKRESKSIWILETEEGCEMVNVRDKNAAAYRKLNSRRGGAGM